MQQVPVVSIVDDDLCVREAAEGLVRSLGYLAASFSSAEEFLDSGRIENTACLITDVHMPGLNGAELQDRLLADGCGIPIIFVTAYPDEQTRGRVLRSGAIGYLSKPFNGEHLIACLHNALKVSRVLTSSPP